MRPAPKLEPLRLRRAYLDWSRPYILGVLNVTPDSFSDGGRYDDVAAAVSHGKKLAADGADIIDIGGESTRPGATPVDAQEEIRRVVPVIRALAAELPVPISVDTTKADVARAAVLAGAELVNDVSGGLFDPAIVEVADRTGAAYVLGHVRGTTLAAVHAAERQPAGADVFSQVARELGERLAALPPALRARTIVDPCLGFGKRTADNLELSRRAGELAEVTGRPVLVGPSRKRFLGELTGAADAVARDAATVGAALATIAAGANLVRVHDVASLRPALTVFAAIAGDAEEPR